jgi:hypothetical protein
MFVEDNFFDEHFVDGLFEEDSEDEEAEECYCDGEVCYCYARRGDDELVMLYKALIIATNAFGQTAFEALGGTRAGPPASSTESAQSGVRTAVRADVDGARSAARSAAARIVEEIEAVFSHVADRSPSPPAASTAQSPAPAAAADAADDDDDTCGSARRARLGLR